ncbi:Transcription initiation factor IIF subunit alpha [Cytospora mali]|uniref:Transcription initiation factor IIF subunit alpha n=1 Tax=Cytospora mali TaxID=578113 RepID=A0A194VX68_CYTMA|nr:Transcription initiation factor IIF subunit alpha [Valsa mali]
MNAPPNGNNPPPPGAPPLRRKKKAGDPLVARKKPVVRPPPKPKNPANANTNPSKAFHTQPNLLGVQAPKVDQKTQEEWKQRRQQNGGWWDPPPAAEDFREFPVYITKKDIKDGLRSHIMRFAKTRTGGKVDVMDETDFARPVTLHRKDARSLNNAQVIKEGSPSPALVDPVEAERIAKIKAEKEVQRANDQAQIAPVTKDAVTKKPVQKPEKASTQTFYAKRSEAHKKEATIRYEESLPWVLEDADGKNTYVGAYTAALSESMAALQYEGDKWRLIPLEKYYKFTHKPPFKTYTIEEAEKLMNKKVVQGRWAMREDERVKDKEEMAATRLTLHGRAKVKTESDTFRSAARSEKQEHDDIDFSGDEFQDDDENPTFEPDNDEDVKESRERVRREQLGARAFEAIDEAKLEEELKREEVEEAARKQGFGKKIAKNLVKLEKDAKYKEDRENSDDLLSESDESDAEKDEVKQEEGEKATQDQDPAKTEGSTSGKPKTLSDKKGKSLKRPGSPNLSEMESSGNESSRKRIKKQATGSVRGSRASTPMSSSQRAKAVTGAMSDGEATGGEMSDAGRKKKVPRVTVVSGSHNKGTPSSSRAGSPVPSGQASPPAGSQSPARRELDFSQASGPVTAADVAAALAAQPQGVTIGRLLSQFGDRIAEHPTHPDQTARKDWVKFIRAVANWGEDKLLRLKNPEAGQK